MRNEAAAMSPALQKIWIRITADKRRFAILCACLGLSLLLWGRLVFLREVPRRAYAEPTASQTLQSSQSPRGTVSRTDARPVVVRVYSELSRDPFALNTTYFPEPVREAPAEQVIPKSPEPTADVEADARERRRLELIEEAQSRLNLVSVSGGARPVAMLRTGTSRDGTTSLVGLGHEIAGFRVVEIHVTARTVTVEKEDVRVTLSMKQDIGS